VPRLLWLHGEIAPTLGDHGLILQAKIERHKSVEPRVFRLIHHTHSTAAQPLEDAVVGDGLARSGSVSAIVPQS